MAAFAGVRGTGNYGTDERPKNFRQGILWLNPNGTAPIFALTSKMGKRSIDDPEFSWWAEPNDHVRLQVNGALGFWSNGVTIVVDSVDPYSGRYRMHGGEILRTWLQAICLWSSQVLTARLSLMRL